MKHPKACVNKSLASKSINNDYRTKLDQYSQVKQVQKNLTIKQILWLGFGTIFVLILMINLVAQSSKNTLVEALDKVAFTYKTQEELEKLDKLLLEAETGQRGFIYTGKEKFLEPYNKANAQLGEQLSQLKTNITDRQQLERLSEVEIIIKQRIDYLSKTVSLKRSGKETEVKEIVSAGTGLEIMNNLRSRISKMKQAEARFLVERRDLATQSKRLSNTLAWSSNLVIIGIGTLISLLITRTIGRSLATAVQVAEQVSAGNLTANVEVNSNNEIGQLLTSFRNMTRSLNTLIRQVQKSSIQVTSSTTEIADSGQQLEATVTEQLTSINQVLATTKEIAATSKKLVKTIEEVTYTSQGTASAAEGGQRNLNHMEATMVQLAGATSSISEKLSAISDKASNISSIITTITKVADQTNLLSLNAAIEAEKAGEYGMGFTVVSREIRRLADQTAVSTLDIAKMVKEMQAAVSEGVMEMDKFTQEVSNSVEDVQSVSWQLTEIIEQVRGITPRFASINQGMEAQSDGADQITEVMLQLSQAGSQTADALREINSAIAQLNDTAQDLRQEISQFKLGKE
jgi:methyl-accepting chemotaxis protein WspA